MDAHGPLGADSDEVAWTVAEQFYRGQWHFLEDEAMTPIAPSRGRAQLAAYALHYRTGVSAYPSGSAPSTMGAVDKVVIPRALPSRERGACLTCAAQQWVTDLRQWVPAVVVDGVEVTPGRLARWSDIVSHDDDCDALFDAESYFQWTTDQGLLLPRAELFRGSVLVQATAYRPTARFLVLHKKVAPLTWSAELHNMVLDEDTPVRICRGCYASTAAGKRPRLALANGLFMGRTLARFAPATMAQAHIYAMSPLRPSSTRVLLSKKHIFDASRLANGATYCLQSGKRGNTTFFRERLPESGTVLRSPPLASTGAPIVATYTGPDPEDMRRSRVFGVDVARCVDDNAFLKRASKVWAHVGVGDAAAFHSVAEELYMAVVHAPEAAGIATVREGAAEATIDEEVVSDSGDEGIGSTIERQRRGGDDMPGVSYSGGADDVLEEIDSIVKLGLKKVELQKEKAKQLRGLVERAEGGEEEDPEIVQEYAERAAELVGSHVLHSVRQLSGQRLLNELALEEELTKKRHVVAARSETPEDMFDPAVYGLRWFYRWPWCDGLPFAPRRGQNVSGMNVSHDEYNAQLFKRDVLEYGSNASAEDPWMEERPYTDSQDYLNRNNYRAYDTLGYRGDVDLFIALTDLARRAKGAKAVRNVLGRRGFQQKIKDILRCTPAMIAEVMLQVTDKASMRTLLKNRDIPDEYKKCLELLQMAQQKQPFSTGSRRRAREVKQSWHLRHGPENVWQTANFADTKRVLFELIYHGTATQQDCTLTKEVPVARALAERRRILSEDPVGQSWFYNLESELMWTHLMGAALYNAENGERLPVDGIAARTFASAGGVLGDIVSLDSPEETQGRGSPHGHGSVRTLGRRNRHLVRELERLETEDPDELARRITAFQEALLREITSKQFCSILEFQETVASGARTIHRGEELPASPCKCMHPDCTCGGSCDRIVEPDVPGRWSDIFCVRCRTYRAPATSGAATLQPTTVRCRCTDEACICEGDCERSCEPEKSLGTSDWATLFAGSWCVVCRRHYISQQGGDAGCTGEQDLPARPEAAAERDADGLPATAHSDVAATAGTPVAAAEPHLPTTAPTPTPAPPAAVPDAAPEESFAAAGAPTILEAQAVAACNCNDRDCSCAGLCKAPCAPTIFLGDSSLQDWCAKTRCAECRLAYLNVRGVSTQMHTENGAGDTTCECIDETCEFCAGDCGNLPQAQIRLGASHLAAWCAQDRCVECRRVHVLAQGFNPWPHVADEEVVPRPRKRRRGPAEVTAIARNVAMFAPWQIPCSSDTCNRRGTRGVVEPYVSLNVPEPPTAAFTKCAECRVDDARATEAQACAYNTGLPRLPMTQQLRAALRFDASRLPAGYERRDRPPNEYTMSASVPHRNEFLNVTAPQPDTNTTDANSGMEYAARPQTGSTASVLPAFHMLPAYGVGDDGRFLGLVNLCTGELLTVEECEAEAQLFARLAAADARACVVHGHKLHQCCATCFKKKNSNLCRFHCYRDVLLYTEKNSIVTTKIAIHKGKRLVVAPHVILSSRDGMMGRLAMVQTHPVEMRTNAWVAMGIRANYDYESIDRVPLTDNDALGLCIHIADAIAAVVTAVEDGAKEPSWSIFTLATHAVERFMSANEIRSDDPQMHAWIRRCIELVDMYATQGWPFVGTATNVVAPIMQVKLMSRKGKTGDERDVRFSRCPTTRALSPTQLARASLHHQAHWAERDAYNMSFYHDQYGTKDLETIEPLLVHQHRAMMRLAEDLKGSNLPGAERAARVLIRMAAAEQNASFLSACLYSIGLYYNRDVIRSYAIRNIFTSFLFWAARMAAQTKGGAANLDAAMHEEPQDYELEAYVVDDEDTRRRRVKAAVQTNDYIITEKYNHKDDYLHRNSCAPGGRLFAPMGMYLWSEVITSADVPKAEMKRMAEKGSYKHPYYAFGGEHPEKKVRAMVFDPTGRAPHLSHPDGPKLCGADWAGVQDVPSGGAVWSETGATALQKAALLMPYECTCYRDIAAFPGESTGDGPPLRCHKFEPFAVLSDHEGGFIKRWHHFLDGEQRRASVFEEWMRRQRLYPSWAMLWQLISVLGSRQSCDDIQLRMLERSIIRGYVAFRTVELATQWNLTCLAGKGALHKLSLDGMSYAPRTGDGLGEDDYGDKDHSAAATLTPAYPIPDAELDRYILMTDAIRQVRLSEAVAGNLQLLTFPSTRAQNLVCRPHNRMTPNIDLEKQGSELAKLKEEFAEARKETRNPFDRVDLAPGISRPLDGTSSLRQLKDAYCAFVWEHAKLATLNQLQLNVCALHVVCIWGYMDFLAKATVSYDQFLIAILGPGGSGKTWMENEVIRPAVRHFFGDAADKAVAPNNAAAKTLGKAMTMHMACKFKQSDVRAKREVNQKLTVTKKDEHESEYIDTVSLTQDEFAMAVCALCWNVNVAATIGRAELLRSQNLLGPGDPNYIHHKYGHIPWVQCLLDFQQLEPVGGSGIEHHRFTEVAELDAYKPDTFKMWKLWSEVDLCVMLTETARFTCPLLKRFCETIRIKGMRIPDELWNAFASCFLTADVPEDERRRRLAPHVPPSEEKMYLATEWALVSRMQRSIVLREGQHVGELVCFCQAVDRVPTGMSKVISDKLLQWANATTLGRMVGLLGVFRGMLARLSQTLFREADVVNDSRVTILDILVHDSEPEYDVTAARARGYVLLKFLPTLKVQVHGLTKDTGHGPGVLIIKPETISCAVKGLHDSGSKTTVYRTQLPLWPDPVGTSQNGQGKTKDSIIADILPSRKLETKSARDKYFREVYLMISRCRTLSGLTILNAPAELREVLEQGPPDHIAEEEGRCAEIHARTFAKAQEARQRIMREAPQFGWTLHPMVSATPPPPPPPPNAQRGAPPSSGCALPSSSTTSRPFVSFYDMNASLNGRAHALRSQLLAEGWIAGPSCLREAAQRACECGYLAVDIVQKMQVLGRALTYTEAKDSHDALFANDAARLREMNAFVGKYEADDSDDGSALDDGDGSPDPHNLDIGELGQLVTTVPSLADMPAALREENISIGTWDDIASELRKWESDTNVPRNFSGIASTADADADGQTDYHFFTIYAYRLLLTPPPVASPPPAPPPRNEPTCCCIDMACACEGSCDNHLEPSTRLGVSEWATWCATTHCVRCRKDYIERQNCSVEGVHEGADPDQPLAPSTTVELPPDHKRHQGLPAGWEVIRKIYQTGAHAGKEYIRYNSADGTRRNLCTPKQVLKAHAEMTGTDEQEVLEAYMKRKQDLEAARQQERGLQKEPARQNLKGASRLSARAKRTHEANLGPVSLSAEAASGEAATSSAKRQRRDKGATTSADEGRDDNRGAEAPLAKRPKVDSRPLSPKPASKGQPELPSSEPKVVPAKAAPRAWFAVPPGAVGNRRTSGQPGNRASKRKQPAEAAKQQKLKSQTEGARQNLMDAFQLNAKAKRNHEAKLEPVSRSGEAASGWDAGEGEPGAVEAEQEIAQPAQAGSVSDPEAASAAQGDPSTPSADATGARS